MKATGFHFFPPKYKNVTEMATDLAHKIQPRHEMKYNFSALYYFYFFRVFHRSCFMVKVIWPAKNGSVIVGSYDPKNNAPVHESNPLARYIQHMENKKNIHILRWYY